MATEGVVSDKEPQVEANICNLPTKLDDPSALVATWEDRADGQKELAADEMQIEKIESSPAVTTQEHGPDGQKELTTDKPQTKLVESRYSLLYYIKDYLQWNLISFIYCY